MKLSVINGKVVGRKRTHVSAPSPAEIAARAYDMAIKRVLAWGGPDWREGPSLERHLADGKAADLAALREEVIKGKR